MNKSSKRMVFSSELRRVDRVGGYVYRASIPRKLSELAYVKASKYLRLKVVAPSVSGKELPNDEFTAKLLEGPYRVQIPKRIIEAKGLADKKFPTSIRLEFIGAAKGPEKRPRRPRVEQKPEPRRTPILERVVPPVRDEEGKEEGPQTPSEVAEETPPPIHEGRSIVPPTKPTEVPSTPLPFEAPPPTPTPPIREKKKEPVESPGLAPLRDAVIKVAKSAAVEEARKICRELIPEEVGEQMGALITERMEALGKQVEALLGGSGVTMPKVEREEELPQTPTKAESPQPVAEKPADEEGVRVISVDEPPRDYGVVREELPEAIPEKPAPAPIDAEEDVHTVEPPIPTPAETLRFEKDSNCISIFIGEKYVSTVSVEVQASGTIYHCGTCSVEAMEKGMKEPTDCEHIRMVKQYLASSQKNRVNLGKPYGSE